jgi:hypothetical protein
LTERVVVTEVFGKPSGVRPSTSLTTGPPMIFWIEPRNWLRTLMAVTHQLGWIGVPTQASLG